MADQYLELIKQRRTYYALERKSPISDESIEVIVQTVLINTPSCFNCQSTRLVILFKDDHERFWAICKDIFKANLSPAEYADYEIKLNERQSGYGTVLLFEDYEAMHRIQLAVPRFAGHTGQFLEHNNAMQAFNIWTALELEGLGCNLQHVNPFVDQRVYAEWDVPTSWSLKAQLVFGSPTGDPNPNKEVVPIQNRLRVHGK